MELNIEIRGQTPEEEYNRIWEVFTNLPFYREKGFYPVLPDDPRILNVGIMAPSYKLGIKDDLYPTFLSEIYNKRGYDIAVNKLKSESAIIQSVSTFFSDLHQKWGFKIFDNYRVLLTKYGLSGSYFSREGKVIVRINEDGTFSQFNSAYTIVHEMTHIGIEEIIVEKYDLTHEEKEQIVGWMCKNMIKDYVPKEYSNNAIMKVLEGKSMGDLPEIIREYKS